MKKKAYIMTIIFLLSIGLMLALTSGKAIKVARCIVPEIGGCLIDEQPVILINKTSKSDLFNGYTIGDKVLIIVSYSSMESYPEQKYVYYSMRLGESNIKNISENVKNELIQLGWLAEEHRTCQSPKGF